MLQQYTTKLDMDKVTRVVHALGKGKIGKKNFNFRLAAEEDNDALTGFSHNGTHAFFYLLVCVVALVFCSSPSILELTISTYLRVPQLSRPWAASKPCPSSCRMKLPSCLSFGWAVVKSMSRYTAERLPLPLNFALP
jgi:hypothetical protein